MTIPHIAPRGNEIAAIEELLESSEYEDGRSLARAILSKAYETLLEREWFLTIVQDGPLSWAYGLSATQGAAAKWQLGADFPRTIIRVASAVGQIEKVGE